MPRTTEELLALMEAHLPCEWYAQARPLTAGVAAALAQAESNAAALATLHRIGSATGIWLDLHGKDQRTPRATGESDADYRRRLQVQPDVVTAPAIEAAVTAIQPIGKAAPVVRNWWEGPHVDAMYLDADPGSRLANGPSGFLLLLDATLDAATLTSIAALVNRIRAAGFYWRIVLLTP